MAARGSKYHNVVTYIGGRRFDSRKEAERWLLLRDAERRGEITDLRCQVRFRLAPCAATYVADFVYTKTLDGRQVVEDVKGLRTAVYKLKKDMMLNLLGISIREVDSATEKI